MKIFVKSLFVASVVLMAAPTFTKANDVTIDVRNPSGRGLTLDRHSCNNCTLSVPSNLSARGSITAIANVASNATSASINFAYSTPPRAGSIYKSLTEN